MITLSINARGSMLLSLLPGVWNISAAMPVKIHEQGRNRCRCS